MAGGEWPGTSTPNVEQLAEGGSRRGGKERKKSRERGRGNRRIEGRRKKEKGSGRAARLKVVT
jgi:hypothetical protein